MKRSLSLAGFLLVAAVTAIVAQPPAPPEGQSGRGPGGNQPGGPGGPGGPRPPLVSALDANDDMVISADEINGAVAALKTLDKNKDGKLTEDEFRPDGRGPGGPGGPGAGPEAGPPRNREGGQGQGPGNQGPGGPGGEGRRGGQRAIPGGEAQGRGPQQGRGQQGGPGAGPMLPTPDEYVERVMEFDTDKDGKLNKDELKKYAEAMIAQRRGGGQGQGPGQGPGRGGPESQNRPPRDNAAGPERTNSPDSERPKRPE